MTGSVFFINLNYCGTGGTSLISPLTVSYKWTYMSPESLVCILVLVPAPPLVRSVNEKNGEEEEVPFHRLLYYIIGDISVIII